MNLSEMTKQEVRDMLVYRAGAAMELARLDEDFQDVFCGIKLDLENCLHVWKEENLRTIADIMGEEVEIEVREGDDKYPAEVYFYTQLFGLKWRVFALSEVAYEN